MDLNKVMIIWRATNNVQLKTIESSGTPVVNFTVATNRKFKNRDGNILEDAEYHRCVAYGKWAEVLGKYLNKWKRVYIEGRLRTRKRQDSEGKEKFSTEIIVDNFIFLDPKGTGIEDDEHILDAAPMWWMLPEDEDVPF
jgi:single-strand DNA-binding protein